jgi:murein DD-endopeptidase MepM/ murein hydrolase activator NlpD
LLFPGLEGKRRCQVNLDAECVRWSSRHPELFQSFANPLLDPAACQKMMDEIHREYGVDWSYGGYLEDRRHLWKGSYLEASGNFLHLGVDMTVPRGTEVAATFEARVMLVDEDSDRDGGWGTRVFLKPERAGAAPLVFIYAHLEHPRCEPGEPLSPGAVFAAVGGPPANGNWHAHLHVQAVRATVFHEILLAHFDELDGYGPPAGREALQADFPDPLPYLGEQLQPPD